jgi:hypothetical protein
MGNTTSICATGVVDELLTFFRLHWAENHPFVRRRDLLDWQHLHADSAHYNFTISRDTEGSVNGMLGFIPSDRFDTGLSGARNTIWQSTWMVLRSAPTRGLGTALLQEVLDTHSYGWTGTCGLDHGTRKIYDRLGYRTGTIHQYFMLNSAYDSYRLASVPDALPVVDVSDGAKLGRLSEPGYFAATDGLGLDESPLIPAKSRAQFFNRYMRHPFYDYALYLVTISGYAAILATRLCEHAGVKALRIVDFLGAPEALAQSGRGIQDLLAATGAEYADLYCSGMEDAVLATGLRNVAEFEDLIIPSHFEPFERKNVELLYALMGQGAEVVICKGDGDQDRPNLLV